MRLIDADALQKALADMWYESQISVTGISVSELIDEQPTVDAVEVVRCKDCKHWQDQEEGVVESAICVREKPMVMEIGPCGYCSFGERRSEDD